MTVAAPPDPRGRRLDSWKEIASYLDRDVRTVQRWERHDALPVRRLQHTKLASVYAYTAELDQWRTARAPDTGGDDPSHYDARAGRTLWMAAALAAAFGLGLAAWTWQRSTSGLVPDPIRTIAVLPIANFSEDPQQEYFADGMTDALIARLSMVPGLFIISRTSVMPFKHSKRRAPEIAQVLNADAIVEGAVVRSAGRVRITIKLIRARTDSTLWAEVFDRDAHDLLELQSEVAQAIARQVTSQLSREDLGRLAATRPVGPEVFDTYLKGMFLLQKDSRATSEEAMRHFEAAIARDPSFAPAHAALARAFHSLGTYFLGGRSPAEARPRAIAAAKEAVRLDPDLPDGHTALAYAEQREWRWQAAEDGYRRAIRLNPSDARALAQLADLLVCLGRFDEGLALVRRARAMDPVSRGTGLTSAMLLYFARQNDAAMRELRTLADLHPDDSRLLWYLGNSLMAASRPDEAIGMLERSVARERNPGPLGFLAIAYASAGRREDAQRVVDELTRVARTSYVPPAAFVAAYVGLGDTDRAFAALEDAYAERSNLMRSLRVLPILDPLRQDSRFDDMLRRVGLR
jgi:TolB-like protein/Tfp pilus assembly protein PilF